MVLIQRADGARVWSAYIHIRKWSSVSIVFMCTWCAAPYFFLFRFYSAICFSTPVALTFCASALACTNE
ncbi:hypothetical protein BOTBODRAFT_244175 [Botryobasidium botryosum FD-172 SS1]|uniref:Uncharacterized protein n=1 Tax=Botryobasidium botryosum (strain FD-172 SS1) TaxID=930990 RepID=A0A067LWL6_BOTB1|nr:hypothetical protein BOTBODRAFT_244175 [Botryobasidium botryosum FD-172 SS1]